VPSGIFARTTAKERRVKKAIRGGKKSRLGPSRVHKVRPLYAGLAKLVRPEELPAVDVAERTFGDGLRVISERLPGASSVATGLWVNAGSQDEAKSKAGIAHFIEHMVFKGTAGKSMREIMRSIESRGGVLNAFTTKEHTSYYTWSRTTELDHAVEILFELAARPMFTDRDIEREKSVVIEEINGLDDEPDELVFDLFEKELFGEHPLARPIIGTACSVGSLTRGDLLRFHSRHYRSREITLVASGAHQHEALFAAIERSYMHLNEGIARRLPKQSTRRGRTNGESDIHRFGGQQAHIILGRRAPGARSRDHMALNALVTLLGVGMGSRLNLRLREELGLAYDATAFYSPFETEGTIGIYVATAIENRARAIREMRQIVRGLFSRPISQVELARTKDQLIGGVLLSLEAVTNRMMRMGQNELYFHSYVPVEEELEKIARLTLEDIHRVSDTFFKDESKLSLVSVLPHPEEGAKKHS